MFKNTLKWQFRQERFSIFLLGLILSCTLVLGWGCSKVLASSPHLPEDYQTAVTAYINNCSSCHIPIPAEVLPTETWRRIISNPHNHYGTKINQLLSSDQILIWNYLGTFSRPLLPGENQPQFMIQSRYFQALHPKVELPEFVTHKTCVECHVNASKLDYFTSIIPD
jgi:hypothetical protein